MNGGATGANELTGRCVSLAVFSLATAAFLALSSLGYLAYTEWLAPEYDRLAFDVPMSRDGSVRCRGYVDHDSSRVVSWDSQTGKGEVIAEYECPNATTERIFACINDKRFRSSVTEEIIVPMNLTFRDGSLYFMYYDGYDMMCGHVSFGGATFNTKTGVIHEWIHVM